MLTQASFVTLLLTSSPLLLLVLPPTFQQARASNLPSKPRCQFPKYLQTKKNKLWMMNHRNTFTTFDVQGGTIFARSGTCVRSGVYPRRRQPGMAECRKSNYTRICLEKRPGDKYLVRHVESDFGDRFACVTFLKRGISVVQVKMSAIQGEKYVYDLCDDKFMHVDPLPWISEEHYRSRPVKCPFTGGYNLELRYSVPSRAGRLYSTSYKSWSDDEPYECRDSTTAPVRMESDCVAREGVVFNFKHELCLPAGTHLSLRQRALCMATWQDGHELFAMLRADNNDRAFFCLRLKMSGPEDVRDLSELRIDDENVEIDEVALFIGWACPTSHYEDAVRRYYGGTDTHPATNLTPHMAFRVLDQQVITDPCTDELSTCHNHSSFCRGLQCMRTCGMCFAATTENQTDHRERISKKATIETSDRFAVRYADSTDDGEELDEEPSRESMSGETPHHSAEAPRNPENKSLRRKCTFPDSIRGTWLQRNADGKDLKIVITNDTFVHPHLGQLECVTFVTPGSDAAPLRRVLWTNYDNGCYPRFTCLHYNTPAKSVMRYRLANIQHWPLALSDDSICDETHFKEPPDMYQPGAKSTDRSWEVVRRAGHIHKIPCILPHYLPKVVRFVDDNGVPGCLMHGMYSSLLDMTLAFFPRPPRKDWTSVKVPVKTHTESHDVDSKGDDVEHRKTDSSGNEHVVGVTERVFHNSGDEESRQWNKATGPMRHGNPSAEAGSRDRHFQVGSNPGKSDHEEKDPYRGQIWSETVRHDYDLEPNIPHKFPPGMTEHDFNKTYRYFNNDNSRTANYHNRGSYGGYAINTNHHPQYKTRSYNNPSKNTRHGKIHARQRGNDVGYNDFNHFYAVNERFRRSSNGDVKSRTQYSYDCLAVMTYVDSYKSLLTMTSGNDTEILCWMVIDASTIVILKTSSCNSQTAQRVLAGPVPKSNHMKNLHKILHLDQGDTDCEALFPPAPVRPEPILSTEDEIESNTADSLVTSNVWTKIAAFQTVLSLMTAFLP